MSRKTLKPILDISYEKIGKIIMLDTSDWARLVKYLIEHGITVKETVKRIKKETS